MKKLLTVLGLVALVAIAAPPSGKVTLVWDYPTNEMTTNLWFNLYHSTNITVPLANWPLMTNIVGTTNLVKIQVVPGEHYFYVTASNWWAESPPSNVAATPPLPRTSSGLQIFRAD